MIRCYFHWALKTLYPEVGFSPVSPAFRRWWARIRIWESLRHFALGWKTRLFPKSKHRFFRKLCHPMLQVMQKLAFLQFAYQSDQNQKDRILLRHCQWTISWIPDSLDGHLRPENTQKLVRRTLTWTRKLVDFISLWVCPRLAKKWIASID